MYNNAVYKALTIAGSDSGGCAGIQADLKTFCALGVFGMSAITAITAQNTTGVKDIYSVSPENIICQIDAVMSDIGAGAVKTGMLFDKDIISAVAERIRYWEIKNFVLDPVMVATTGSVLLKEDAIDEIRRVLIPLALVSTPNTPEAEVLTGIKIHNEEDMMRACKVFIDELNAGSVIIKGGHIYESDCSTDIFYDGVSYKKFSSPKVDTRNLHGTGCTFSAAIAGFLSKGNNLLDSIAFGKEYISNAIESGKNFKIGAGDGPVDHFWRFR